jgi:protease-4
MNTQHPNETDTILHAIALEYYADKKRKRFWKWCRRGLFLLCIAGALGFLFLMHAEDIRERTIPHVGLIDIKGEIADTRSGGADNLMKGLAKAYESPGLKALILRIDSPGGSPVQADYMYSMLRDYKQKYPAVNTYAVCLDTCASAAYYVAAATDFIYANPASMVGSIGVVYNGFGFVDVMRKVGVTRRLHVAGANKGFLDPFSPESDVQTSALQTMLDLVHDQFIARVREGRGDRLIISDDLFSGLIWTGTQAKTRGLIDGFASPGQLAREIIKIEAFVDYTSKPNMHDQMTKSLGTAMIDSLPVTLSQQPGLRL